MHDKENDSKNSVFKVIVYAKYEFKFFQVLKFLTGPWSVRLLAVGWLVGQLIGGQLVGGFKETPQEQGNGTS